jgi:hypothetical protein
VELCPAWLIEHFDGRNVVTIAESEKDSLENLLIELAALRDDHIAQRKVQGRRISASVACSPRAAAHKPTFSKQLVRDRIDSYRSIQRKFLAAYLFQPVSLSSRSADLAPNPLGGLDPVVDRAQAAPEALAFFESDVGKDIIARTPQASRMYKYE